ncbi:MAG: hypothetical protein KC466_04525 [Myxococcales bacterium]|nr:hypothetical protein [Myxococcales bacterium]
MARTRKLILYHAQCADGLGAAWSAWKALGDDADYVAVKHGEPPPGVEGREVTIVDFSYPRPILLDLRARAAGLEVIDHHKSAQEDLAGLDFARFDMTKSGAVLAWEHWHPREAIPEILRYVQDKDLWRWELPESEEVSAALASYPYDVRVFDSLRVPDLRAEGKAILRYQNQLVDEIVAQAGRETIAGYDVPSVNASILQSYVGNRLAAGEAFAAIWFQKPDGRRRYSLRSSPPKGIDVSEIARRFGGGGHAAAAGFDK